MKQRNSRFMNSWRRLGYKLAPYAIQNLMTVVIGAMAIIYIADGIIGLMGDVSLISYLEFDRDAIIHSFQIWRAVTFIFIPSGDNILWAILMMYFYWVIGQALEKEFGAFRFNLFYFLGAALALIAGFITGYTTNSYLNLSLFLAFAIFYPNFEVRLFFILPIKVKYMAIVYAIVIGFSFIMYPWQYRIVILLSLLNVVIFFWRDFRYVIRTFIQDSKIRFQRWKNQ
ncbi:MAG: derlin [Clostridiales bacterium]|nr:derlin [Clostridia bacterium]MCD8055800.1 derlin [Clostridiales bacterium]